MDRLSVHLLGARFLPMIARELMDLYEPVQMNTNERSKRAEQDSSFSPPLVE